MRSLIDNKFSNLVKSNQALKLSQNPLVNLTVSIENFNDTGKIEAAYIQRRLSDLQKMTLAQEEFDWLNTTGMFEKSFLAWLKSWKFPKFNLIEKDDQISINIQVPYSEAVIAERLLQACLSEAKFIFYLNASGEEAGRFYAFGSDRYNIKTGGFLNSRNIYIIEDAVGLRPDPDWYALLGVFLSAAPFNFVGTTNPFHAMSLAQPIVTYCDEERWLEGWPDSNFAPSEKTFDEEKYKGFVLDNATSSLAFDMRQKYPNAIFISPETNVFEIAHTTVHVANIIFSLGQELVQDLNIKYYEPQILWEE